MTLFYLYPDGVDANAWTGGTYTDVDDPGLLGYDDDQTKITWNGVNDSEARFTLSTMPTVASITSARHYFRVYGDDSTVQCRGVLRSGGVNYYGPYINQTGAYTTYADTPRTVDPNTGVAWTVAGLNALIAGVTAKDTGGGVGAARCTQIFVEVDAVALPAKLGAARHRGSVTVHLRGRPLGAMVARLGLLALDRELLDQAAWQHFAGPTVKDAGWGIRPWERRLGALMSREFDMDALEVTVQDYDLRRYIVNLRDTAYSEEVPSTQYQGVLRLDPGAGRVFVRATAAWIDNPAAALQGLVAVTKIPADCEKLATLGELIEPARTNSLQRSSLKDGLTGLTAVGTAGQTTADTTTLLFESGESGNSLKITRNATVEDQGRTWPVTAAFAANDRVVWSIDYKNDSAVAVSAYLQRSSDAQYYRDSDGTWQVALTYNALPLSGTTTIARWVSKVINVGAGAPTLTATIVHKSTDANGTISHIYHHQIELGRSATSRILTTTATVTRNRDDLKIENFTGKVVYDPARGSGYVDWIPLFNQSEEAAVLKNIFFAYKDANNYDRLVYDTSGASLVFQRVLAGAATNASYAIAVTRGTVYRVGFRWTGSDAEEDLAAYTLSVFVNGVKGTDGVPGGTWTPGASEYLYIGQTNAGAELLDSYLRQIVIRPFVLADSEFLDQP